MLVSILVIFIIAVTKSSTNTTYRDKNWLFWFIPKRAQSIVGKSYNRSVKLSVTLCS